MENMEITEKWYYLIVQDPGTSNEQVVGFTNENTNENFLPAFKTQQDAKACFALMPKDIFKGKYEVQAVIEEDILITAKKEGHKVFLLDDEGKILKELNN